MNNQIKNLLDRAAPYIQQNPYFDIVETKFGLVQIFAPEGDGMCPEIIPNYAALRQTIIREIAADTREASGLTHDREYLHVSEAETVFRTAQAYFTAPDDLAYLRQYLENETHPF